MKEFLVVETVDAMKMSLYIISCNVRHLNHPVFFTLMIALQEVTPLTLTPHLTRTPAHTARCPLNTAEASA